MSHWKHSKLFADGDGSQTNIKILLKQKQPIYYIEEPIRTVKAILDQNSSKLDDIRAMLTPKNRNGQVPIILKGILTKTISFPLVVLSKNQKLYSIYRNADETKVKQFLLKKINELD